MRIRTPLALAIGTAVALASAVPVTAFAQQAPAYSGGYAGGGYYDPCLRDRRQRGTGGALVGAGIGALAGNGIASRGAKTEGAVLGGILGAVIGGNVGAGTAACGPSSAPYGAPPPPPRAYNGGYGGGYYGGGYGGGYAPAYDPRYDGYAEPVPAPVPVAQAPGGEDCALAESPIYLPDGSVQKRFVRVCRASDGRYVVVD